MVLYKCAECPALFHSLVYLKVHVRSFWPRPYACLVCFERFVGLFALKQHQSLRCNSCGPHACPVCFRRFANRSLQHRHVRHEHPAVKWIERDDSGPHACDVCDARFARVSLLVAHLHCHLRNIHRRKRAYKRLAERFNTELNRRRNTVVLNDNIVQQKKNSMCSINV